MEKREGWGCGCKGKCGPSAMDRRAFLKTTALAAGVAGVLAGASRAEEEEAARALAEWTRTLFERGARRVYRGEELANIAIPMGGIGAGQVYLRGDGRLGPWQMVNNFNTQAMAPGSFFGVWARPAGQEGRALLLQQGEEQGVAGAAAISFSGEYPFAWLDYETPGMPVQVSLEAYSPMIPLDALSSGLPAVVFRFTVKNQTGETVEASLLAAAPNLVGWEGYAGFNGVEYPEFGGNVNVVERESGNTHVVMRAETGGWPSMAAPFLLATNHRDVAWNLRLCQNVSVQFQDKITCPETSDPTVFWLGDFTERPSTRELKEMLLRVSEGAALVLSGGEQGPLSYAGDPKKKSLGKGKTFEDWESGKYDFWSIQGDAFGVEPAAGTLDGQQNVSGHRGKRLLSSFHGGDAGTGRARSKTFKIKSDYIHLLVGGGRKPGQTCVNLMVADQVALSATGQDSERLQPICWDVSKYRGKAAFLEVVDESQEGWGHVSVDDIVFSDSPVSPFISPKLASALHDALPFTYWRAAAAEHAGAIDGGALHPALAGHALDAGAYLRFRRMRLRKSARVVLEDANGVPLVIVGTYGKGNVVFCNGRPETWTPAADRRTVIGALAALALGTTFVPGSGLPEDHPFNGSMALSALSEDACATAQWDDFQALWKDFAQSGRLASGAAEASAPGRTWNAAAAIPMTLRPGEVREARFVLSWHFPNRTRNDRYGWGPKAYQYDHRLGNFYNNHFGNAFEVARHVSGHLDQLEGGTRAFHAALYDSTLPRWFTDCVSANASITRSPIYVWIEDGTVGGFEGSDSCCPMNCTHVYNYAMSMAYLYPALERNVRETDLLRQMNPDEHYIPHRTVLPLSLPRLGNEIGGPHHHALDGELSTLLKMYREWRMSGDRAWLRTLWPNAKLVMEHVLRDHDTDGNGVIRGEQPNTYDTHLYGTNTFIGTLYLATLRAVEEMAKLMGDQTFAAQCRARFEQGRQGYDERCWNGEYYVNLFDAPDVEPTVYNETNCYGPGCHADQVLGQWWAHILGLGYVLPEERVKSALSAIHKYSWRQNFVGHLQQPRRFADDDERGLLICTWPNGERPERPILYCDEIWTGIEYHVAATMIYEGMIEAAFQIVRGARDRYTGARRNPWSEIECGGHYARAMSSYSLLHAAAGLDYDAGSQSLRINPRVTPDDFRCFFTAAKGWGNVSVRAEGHRHVVAVDIKYGELVLRQLTVPSRSRPIREISITGQPRVAVRETEDSLVVDFRRELRLTPGQPLEISWRE